MEKRFDKLDKAIADLREEIHSSSLRDEQRLTKLETTQRGFMAVISLILTGVVTYITDILKP